ncbi:MAG: hypothetical protein ABSB10_10335 [Candidatus Bathyarchaeia archaeon]
MLRKALKRPHHLPHYIYWKAKPIIFQSYFRLKLGTKTFKFQGHAYNYFCNKYNTTWKNERAVEVPIVREIVKHCNGKILEVGNVLSHYYPVTHDVVDKYEKAKGVINQDVVDFRPSERYDLIVSISTMEHMGWDENHREPEKVLYALENLKSNCLAHRGIMVITAPLGYNPELDKLLKQGMIDLGKQYYMKRLSKDNLWKETEQNNVQNIRYDTPFPAANAIVIAIKDMS